MKLYAISVRYIAAISFLLTTAGCSNETSFAPVTEHSDTAKEEIVHSMGTGKDGFEMSSGAVVNARDQDSELSLNATVGSPVSTYEMKDATKEHTVNMGFWSLLDNF